MWKYHINALTKKFFIIKSVLIKAKAFKRVFSKCYLISDIFKCKYHAKILFHQIIMPKNHVIQHIFKFLPYILAH